MSKATIGHGSVTSSHPSGVAGITDGRSKPTDIAEQICATAFTDGKIGGVYVAALGVLAQRLKISQEVLNEALAAGIGGGWLRHGKGQGDGKADGAGQVELTAAGIYIAKLSLKLPT